MTCARALAVWLAGTVFVLLAAPDSRDAAFPGRNGKLAYHGRASEKGSSTCAAWTARDSAVCACPTGRPIRAESEVRNSRTYGVLQLRLRSRSYHWRFVLEAGRRFTDSGAHSCH